MNIHITKHFPPAERYKISKNNLENNIKNQFNNYANEEWETPGNKCIKQKRVIDRISNEELKMIVAFSAKSKYDSLKDLSTKELVKSAETLCRSKWRRLERESCERIDS